MRGRLTLVGVHNLASKIERRIGVKYGYARISTIGQDLRAQIATLEKEGCDKIYTEKFTGTKIDRKEINQLLDIIEAGDTLVVTKLDRFARSVKGGIERSEER